MDALIFGSLLVATWTVCKAGPRVLILSPFAAVLHLFVLAYCVVLIAAFGAQFSTGEYPCPLCMPQRMATVPATLGPPYVITQTRNGDVSQRDYATGYRRTRLRGAGPGPAHAHTGRRVRNLAKLVLGLFLGIVAAELVTTFLLPPQGFHWFLPDNPSRYEIFH